MQGSAKNRHKPESLGTASSGKDKHRRGQAANKTRGKERESNEQDGQHRPYCSFARQAVDVRRLAKRHPSPVAGRSRGGYSPAPVACHLLPALPVAPARRGQGWLPAYWDLGAALPHPPRRVLASVTARMSALILSTMAGGVPVVRTARTTGRTQSRGNRLAAMVGTPGRRGGLGRR